MPLDNSQWPRDIYTNVLDKQNIKSHTVLDIIKRITKQCYPQYGVRRTTCSITFKCDNFFYFPLSESLDLIYTHLPSSHPCRRSTLICTPTWRGQRIATRRILHTEYFDSCIVHRVPRGCAQTGCLARDDVRFDGETEMAGTIRGYALQGRSRADFLTFSAAPQKRCS